jgi:enoyl-CoA hydratase/carnithine racemase
MSDQHILTELADGVLTITINRPEKKNALTVQMYADIVAALHGAEENPAARVVLLRGVADDFTSGNDLKDFRDTPPAGEDSPVFQLLLTLADMKTPIVAAVRGVAIGIGVTGLLHCDLAYAADDARFQLPFVNLGLTPEGGSSLLLPRYAGAARASELLLLGEPFDANTALHAGILSNVFSVADFDAEVERRVKRLAAQPAAALRATKKLLRGPAREELRETLGREGAAFMERLASPEALEAFTAFLEKRAPDFTQFD